MEMLQQKFNFFLCFQNIILLVCENPLCRRISLAAFIGLMFVGYHLRIIIFSA